PGRSQGDECAVELTRRPARPSQSGSGCPELETRNSEKGTRRPARPSRSGSGCPELETRNLEWVKKTLPRSRLWAIQTPQAFKRELLEMAFKQAYADGFYGTDEASLLERIGIPVRLVPGSDENIKITTPKDLVLAEVILKK
ncbi:MAG: 2-C-methyl-D-erythritol 4-phosphate cytidylyltransferase, partial [bacterium]|nr:2-C-methyl-D-erythritol 4-phosphate cytidylyltransferase [bacterium]